MESYGRRIELEQKKRQAALRDEIMVLWNQNMQLLNMMNASQHPDDVKLRTPAQYYPELFGEEMEQQEQEEQIRNDLALHKARMEEYAFRHNLARKERGESNGWHDTGKAPGNNRGTDRTISESNAESAITN